MTKRITLAVAFVTLSALGQEKEKSGSSVGTPTTQAATVIPKTTCGLMSCSSEPIVVGDGSVEVYFYGPVTWINNRTLMAGAWPTSKGQLMVPSANQAPPAVARRSNPVQVNRAGLVAEQIPAKADAHATDSYTYVVERLFRNSWVPYTHLTFTPYTITSPDQKVVSVWNIASPALEPPLFVNRDPIRPPKTFGLDLTEPWAGHTLTVYQFYSRAGRIRLGSVAVVGQKPIPMGTGCSSFRIEPDGHHALPPMDHPCPNASLPKGKKLPIVNINGVDALDISSVLVKSNQ